MKLLAKSILILLATALVSGPAFGAIDFSDDFESYVTPPDGNAIGGGWTAFANVFTGFPACNPYLYGYGPFPTPNSDSAFSNIALGSTGQALNVFSNYDDDQHASGNCIETSVFQELVFSAADTGSYRFLFDTEVPAVPLGADVNTYGFVKLLDPNNGFSLDLFEQVSTVAAGSKSITVALDATADGKILQWGFSTVASNYEASGRLYDNVEFSLAPVAPPIGPSIEGVPIPLWAFLGMVGLIGLIGGSRLLSRRKV